MRHEFELDFWRAVVAALAKPKVSILPYIPARRQSPQHSLQVLSAWEGIQNILADLIERFHIDTRCCLEFGVEYGFSTVALCSYFESVTGVDLFHGDRHLRP